MKNVYVNFSSPAAFGRNLVHKSVTFLKKELGISVNSLIINFVSSEEILDVNIRYLGHNYLTDIITFDYSETKSVLDGEIYICTAELLRNSIKFGCSLEEEVIRMITHGILHMLGYNDKKAGEKKIMKKSENFLVNKQKTSGVL